MLEAPKPFIPEPMARRGDVINTVHVAHKGRYVNAPSLHLIERINMKGEITGAISGKLLLEITYLPGQRVIEPHAFGRGADGQLLLRAYQVAGASASGEHENWKLFRLDRVTGLRVTDDPFDGPREGYKRGDKAMKGGIISEL